MRRVVLWLLILCGACSLLRASALVDTDGLHEALPDAAEEILDEEEEFSSGIRRIGQSAMQAVRQLYPKTLRTVGLLLLVPLLCAVLRGLVPVDGVLTMAGALAMAGLCLDGMTGLFTLAKTTLDELEQFTAALLAALSAAVTVSGSAAAGTALYTGTMLFLHVLLRCIRKLLLPLVYGYLAAVIGAAAIGNEVLARVAELMKWGMTAALKWSSTAFVAYLSITGVVSGSVDSAAIKAAKLAFSTAVPVVGSILSDASETLLVSASLVKNAVGVFGMLGLLAICVLPFLRIGMQYLGLKAVAALSTAMEGGALAKLADRLAGAMGMLLAMCAVAGMVGLLSCVCAMRVMA